MTFAKDVEKTILEFSQGTPDPLAASESYRRLLAGARGMREYLPRLGGAATLFSLSRFLATFAVRHPEELVLALAEVTEPLTAAHLAARVSDELMLSADSSPEEAATALRLFKKRYLLRLTLRDLNGESDVMTAMQELSILAEVVLDAALRYALEHLGRRFGPPPSGGRMALIGLGKLGGEELNYSSDVDLMAVYPDRDAEGETRGVRGPTGVLSNRVTGHEFYSKVVELLTRLLSMQMEEGIVYRVDLRLRPQGQRGEAALPVASYRDYYDTWGRTWERMALIRARPVAGDPALGRRFMAAVEPFLWRRPLDYAELEDIRAMKKKIDSTLSKDDIKRGWGGIREAEFFVQTFQLLYGAENGSLRTHRLMNATQGLRWLGLVPPEELSTLWENYLFLRRVEHVLQMRDDVQTHSLPEDLTELAVLGRHLGFDDVEDFRSELRARRRQTRTMYNTLLGTAEDMDAEALALLEGDLSAAEAAGYLAFRGMRESVDGAEALRGIREYMAAPRSGPERAAARHVLPRMLEEALLTPCPHRALRGIERFCESHGMREAYLSALTEEPTLRKGILGVFSLSTVLTALLLSAPRYLNSLIEEMPIRKSLRRMEEELERSVRGARDVPAALALYRGVEDLRLGMFFLSGILSEDALARSLSHVADAVVRAVMRTVGTRDLSVMAMGKLGGRELTFGSDLDLIFVSKGEKGLKVAEQVIRLLSSYTPRGVPYQVDARLRPDGSRGALVNDVDGYRDYYRRAARGWEFQALLKARPVEGDAALARDFLLMAREVLGERGREVRRADITAMRHRIVSELAREDRGMDVKLGPGGLEEIEFHTQWLQLKNAERHPQVLVQNTGAALGRLAACSALSRKRMRTLREAHASHWRLHTFLRLNDEAILPPEGQLAELAATFMGEEDAPALASRLRAQREAVLAIAGAKV